MAPRRAPNLPKSPFDPKGKQTMSHNDFGKMQRPQRRHEQGKMCWCGDPTCPGDKSGGPFTATETANNRDSIMSPNSFSDLRQAMMVEVMRRSIQFGEPASFSGENMFEQAKPSVPQTYTEARKAVEKYLLAVNHETAWGDVVGNDKARAALVEAIEEPKNNPDLYKFYGMTPPKGVMLYGPPGCGKTMLAKAAAAAVSKVYGTKSEVIVINGPEIQSPYIGVTEETIRAVFKFAREYAKHHGHPLTVFIDEAEVLFPDRTGRTRRVAPWEESNVAQFLSEMDGLNDLGAFVILATNRPEAIDEALLRDGRCDRKIKVERPTRDAVEHILRNSLKDVPVSEDIETLVFAGAESFYNSHYVIQPLHMIKAALGEKGIEITEDVAVNFNLEHVISGAMVSGVARRAKSRAFTRDRETGTRSGITSMDIISAVTEIYEENKELSHSFAMEEFTSALKLERAASDKAAK